MKLGIVLSGGGAKGAYQIGVWKALRKMNISYDIVTGTSVGALNAALMTQNTYHRACFLWKNLGFKDVIDENVENSQMKNVLKTYVKGITNGGVSVTNLEKTIDETLNLKKLYNSKIDMGIVTVKYKNLEPVLLTKNQIKPSELRNYLVASASCFPAFQKKEIDEIEYVDGGVFDNLPINLAIDMGAEEIIAIDLKEVGLKRKVKNKNIKITTISPHNDMGSFLVFDSFYANRAIRLGFNDTLKKFGKKEGYYYTFHKGQVHKNFIKYHEFLENSLTTKITESHFLKIMERAGKIFELNDEKIYHTFYYNDILKKSFLNTKIDLSVDKMLKSHKFKQLFSSKVIIKYIYDLLGNDKNQYKKIIKIFAYEYEVAVYLKAIIEG